MIRIMFVCHGNICRSPMAEFVMKDMVKKAGRENDFLILSSATSAEEIWNGVGRPVYPPAKEELARHGIDCGTKTAVQLQKKDYDQFDLFVCMDENNLRNILRLFGGDPLQKVKKLLSYIGEDRDVADPWYTHRFDVTYRDIKAGCEQLLKTLTRD